MKKNYLLASVASIALASASAFAVPITGSIDMAGGVILNSVSLAAATAATSFSNVQVENGSTGSYLNVPGGTAVTWSGFSWGSFSPVSPLWTFTYAGRTYSFSLSSITTDLQTSKFLNLSGAGTLTISGTGPTYDPTFGDWSFTISNSSGGNHANFQFAFANSQTAAAVPDGGSLASLMGAALIGLGLVQRKLK